MGGSGEVAALAKGLDVLVGRFITRRRAFYQRHGVPPAQSVLLELLFGAGRAVSMKHIAEGLGVVPRTVTSLVDGLESRGLVARSPDPADRRSALVSLTRPGEGLVALLTHDKREAAQVLFAGLTDEERALFGQLLDKIVIEHGDGGLMIVRTTSAESEKCGADTDRA
jgi:DNA-binding MarR family transcriptional regulator